MTGPSPRGWGILHPRAHPDRGERTIPTRVGNTRAQRDAEGEKSDHPHAGGEYHLFFPPCRWLSGPSPRGWGIQERRETQRGKSRTIPTRVGNTIYFFLRADGSADHPHAGGEYKSAERRRGGKVGPSPRGWGIPFIFSSVPMAQRTIPTRVGNTSVWRL